MEILSTDIRKARKDHVCDYCGLKIPKGEKYENQTNVFDGLYHWKSHLDCHDLASALGCFDACDGEGVTGEHFSEAVRSYLWQTETEFTTWEDGLEKVKKLVLKEAK